MSFHEVLRLFDNQITEWTEFLLRAGDVVVNCTIRNPVSKFFNLRG